MTNINFVVYRLVRDSALVIVLTKILRAYQRDFDLFYINQLITQRKYINMPFLFSTCYSDTGYYGMDWFDAMQCCYYQVPFRYRN